MIRNMFGLMLLAVMALTPPASAACDSECERLDSLLSDCNLPPVSLVWTDSDTERRNITGWPYDWWQLGNSYNVGPSTKVIANISQAECLCPDARTEAVACMACHGGISGDSDDQNKLFEVHSVVRDCRIFGYFDNANLTYPSTTRSAMPSDTSLPDGDLGTGACNDICGPMQAQASECDLTLLDAPELPDQVNIPNATYLQRQASFLLNRTAAECMCTLPVLRRSPACRFCLSRDDDSEDEPQMRERVDQYASECNDMGYWSDDEFVIPDRIFEDEEDTEDRATGTSTTDGSSPSSTDDSDGAGTVLAELIPLSLVLAGLMFMI